ncbi:MAG: hypothetical protein KDA97_14995, partial [Acidimicrobiales bacterium]|nr:hypothetical protein [Acidimicrobiales bacterium]
GRRVEPMGWFGRKRADDEGHEAPVEIDLGMRHVYEVQVVVGALNDEGCRTYLVDQSDLAYAAELHPKRCRVLVAPADEARAREAFAEAGFL